MLLSSSPTSQKNREIAFLLDDRANGRPQEFASLVIRPEELTRTEPSRMTVHHTLGDDKSTGWVDSFGLGLPTINIAGTTGWRGSPMGGGDGEALFKQLNQTAYLNWHTYRQEAVNNGKDPADVKLIFSDDLDGFAWEVAPVSFVLRRSKQRPLLMQYSIQLQTVSFNIDGGEGDSLFGFGDFEIGLGSLEKVVNFFEAGAAMIENAVNKAVNFVMGPINTVANAVKRVVNATNRIFGAVRRAVGAVVGGVSRVANGLIGIARDVAEVGKNIFRTMQAVKSLPSDIKRTTGQVAAAYQTAFCILKNSVRGGRVHQNYTDLYGASNCSSTTGGRAASPLSDYNVFDALAAPKLPVEVNSTARQSIGVLRVTDPVLNPMPMPELGRHAGNVADGVRVESRN